MENKEVLDQTPPGGTVVGGLGPAHGTEVKYQEATAVLGRFDTSDPVDVAFGILMVSAKYPGSVPVDVMQAAHARLIKALELSQEELAASV